MTKIKHQILQFARFPFRIVSYLKRKQQMEKSISCQKALQTQLMESYRLELDSDLPAKALHEIGFSTFSENNEDGVLLYLFSIIGTSGKTSIEIGCGYGSECNTANLLIHHNWKGLLIDGGEKQTIRAKRFFSSRIRNKAGRPVIVNAHVTKENINNIIEENGFSGEVDLISIDIDGVDYWIWNELTVCNPRVVVVEVQSIWGSERPVTVPYHHHFEPDFVDGYGVYSGASLAAFNKLAKRKGYRFVGVEKSGYNAFFLRNDIAQDYLPEEDLSVIDERPFVIWAKEQFFEQIKDKEWVEV